MKRKGGRKGRPLPQHEFGVRKTPSQLEIHFKFPLSVHVVVSHDKFHPQCICSGVPNHYMGTWLTDIYCSDNFQVLELLEFFIEKKLIIGGSHWNFSDSQTGKTIIY